MTEYKNPPQNWYQYFGLYDQKTHLPLPLRKVLVDAKINEYIAEVAYSQTFYNSYETRIETEYFFPISPDACFHSFQANFGSTSLQGQIREKKEAEDGYKLSLEEGDVVVYAKLCGKESNVMCVKIGNIPPLTEIEVIFSCIERVEVYLNKCWRFKVFGLFFDNKSELTSQMNDRQTQVIMDKVSDSERLVYDIKVLVNSRHPITFIKSISHEVEIKQAGLGNSYSAQVSLRPEKRYIPDKDFVLLYTTKEMNKPNYLLSPFEHGYCMLMHFFPDLSYLTFDDCFVAANQGKSLVESLMGQAKREYLFIIDESEFTDSLTLTLMKETLIGFLKKLPDGSYFNIIGVNQTSIAYTQKSTMINDQALISAVQYIEATYQTFGGVDLEHLFDFVGKVPYIDGYTRKIFTLTSEMTEGPVNDTIQILLNKLKKEEIFIIEVRPPIKTGRAGKINIQNKLIHEKITSKDEINEKVSYLLRNSLLPHFSDFDLKIEDESLCAYIIPLPKAISCISPNKLVEFFIIFNKKLKDIKKTNFTVKFFNSQNNRYENYKGEINTENADPSDPIIKLGMAKFCDSLLAKAEIFQSMKNKMAEEFEKDVSQKLLTTSLKYGILTSKTAFFCKVMEGNDVLRQIPCHTISTSELIKNASKEIETKINSRRRFLAGVPDLSDIHEAMLKEGVGQIILDFREKVARYPGLQGILGELFKVDEGEKIKGSNAKPIEMNIMPPEGKQNHVAIPVQNAARGEKTDLEGIWRWIVKTVTRCLSCLRRHNPQAQEVNKV